MLHRPDILAFVNSYSSSAAMSDTSTHDENGIGMLIPLIAMVNGTATANVNAAYLACIVVSCLFY